MISKQKTEYGQTGILLVYDCPPKLTGKEEIIRKAAKKAKGTLEEQQRLTGQVEEYVNRTTIICEPQTYDLYERIERRKPLLKERKNLFCSQHVED